MKIAHWMKKEDSGLARTTLEIVKYEERAGHKTCVRQPSDGMAIYGTPTEPDIHSIHSQIQVQTYYDRKPKLMWMHGEPLSSVGNGVSMKSICDLAPLTDAFICMRPEELAVWTAIKRTHLITKGVDLEVFKPLEGVERLSGAPAVLYVENWRRSRNPLYLCLAMQEVHRKIPDARLHLYNCRDKRMADTFQALSKECKWWPFLRTISGPIKAGEMNELYNRADMVVSCLYPLYARGIEAFAAGKAFIGPGYNGEYPWRCELDPQSVAEAILDCWENYDQVDYRQWAEDHHDAKKSAAEAVEVYEKYL